MRILLRYLLKLLDWFLNEGNSEMNCRTRYETTDKLMLDIRTKSIVDERENKRIDRM